MPSTFCNLSPGDDRACFPEATHPAPLNPHGCWITCSLVQAFNKYRADLERTVAGKECENYMDGLIE